MSTKGQHYKHDKSIPSEKVCLSCNKFFNKNPKETWEQFKIKIFCSYKCLWKSKKGKSFSWLNRGGSPHTGYKHSLETRKKMSEKSKGRIPWNKDKPSLIKGEKHPLWKGGSSISDRLRSSYRNQEWIRGVFKRDNWTCVECGRRRVPGDRVILEADHILPFSYLLDHVRNNFPKDSWYEVALEYQPLWDVSNGRTLCKECHVKTDTYAGRVLSFKNF